MPAAPTYLTIGPIPEKGIFQYTGVLQDEKGNAIAAASLFTLTLTLINSADGSIINSRNNQNILNANNVTVDASGNLAWTSVPADSPIVQTTPPLADGRTELHQATFEWTWAGGAKANKRKVWILVEQYTAVPA